MHDFEKKYNYEIESEKDKVQLLNYFELLLFPEKKTSNILEM